MSVVKINAITVDAEHGDELARRFSARAGEVDRQEGFEGFELLRPNDDRTTWLVVTHWRDEESFQAWMSSPAFADQHRAHPSGQAPVAMSSELWSYQVVTRSAPPGSQR
ncbi:MAG: antibiotic biosynthesis monooxygenase family protein [Acidimicrobiales bacterium]